MRQEKVITKSETITSTKNIPMFPGLKRMATYTDFSGHQYVMSAVEGVETDYIVLSIIRKGKEPIIYAHTTTLTILKQFNPDCLNSETALLIAWVAMVYQNALEKAKDIRSQAQVLLNQANEIENEWM